MSENLRVLRSITANVTAGNRSDLCRFLALWRPYLSGNCEYSDFLYTGRSGTIMRFHNDAICLGGLKCIGARCLYVLRGLSSTRWHCITIRSDIQNHTRVDRLHRIIIGRGKGAREGVGGGRPPVGVYVLSRGYILTQ